MRLNFKQWLALVCVLGLGLWALVSMTGPDDADDARQCRANHGVYLWHKRECVGKQARLN